MAVKMGAGLVIPNTNSPTTIPRSSPKSQDTLIRCGLSEESSARLRGAIQRGVHQDITEKAAAALVGGGERGGGDDDDDGDGLTQEQKQR